MKEHGVGAIPVVLDNADPLLEGIITDRDLCCGVIARTMKPDAISVGDLMTRVPVTCEGEDTVEFCEGLMQENQVRRIPVVDKNGRCIGIVALGGLALHVPASQIARTIAEISKSSPKKVPETHLEKDNFYCGQPHELDEILLLNRRREKRISGWLK
jgi:signal-transduction protein with cAMP-binding, CBS, and nucleotidyltransferase domain